jgi:hemerythrin-like domain-containing protein
MSSTTTLPSLFGRFTAILQEHEHLGKTLRKLRQMCAALEAGESEPASELAPLALLVELRRDLGEHFAAEEDEAYFGTVVDEAPSLAPDIAGLKWEHMTMLRAADVLHDLAADRSRWSQLSKPTRELVAQLERHERSESKLLRRFFSPQR